jgi:broad specificity phosphatase PhoE
MRGVLLVRHGNTTFDKKVDALLDPPLDEEGIERTKRTVDFLDKSGYQFSRIVSSPLQRTLRVAEMISQGNKRVTVNNAALPWNLGDLMGKQASAVHDKIQYLHNYPDIKAPHGESYRTFYNRWAEFLYRLMDYTEAKDEMIMVATHSRNIDALQSIIGGAPVGDIKEEAPNDSVTLLANNVVSNWTFDLIWDGR